jgi:hypothetical protein
MFCLCVLPKEPADWLVQIQLKNAKANQNTPIQESGRRQNARRTKVT